MTTQQPTIIYTLTDEAPLLATYAFLPVIRTFAGAAGIGASRKPGTPDPGAPAGGAASAPTTPATPRSGDQPT